MKEQILLFCFDDADRLSAVRKTLLPLRIACKVVAPEDWNTPIGALVGLTVEKREGEGPCAALSEEMLIMCGLTEGGIQTVVAMLRKAGLYIPYKAVLTPYNKDWTASELFAELYQEHQMMMQQRQSAHSET